MIEYFKKQFAWQVWFWWVMACVAAGFSLDIFYDNFPYLPEVTDLGAWDWLQTASLLFYTFVQWLVLHHYFPKIKWWIPATYFSIILFTNGFDWITDIYMDNRVVHSDQTYGNFLIILGAITSGVVVGTAQWIVYHPHMPRAELWVASKIAGALFSLGINALMHTVFITLYPLGFMYSLILLFKRVTCGAITGIYLAWAHQQLQHKNSLPDADARV
ncbi:MAG: hypothetical protein OEZ02_07995 [Anaerolineae bacterium]|nr:hypothetical protein [Anaerolineae bacterium]